MPKLRAKTTGGVTFPTLKDAEGKVLYPQLVVEPAGVDVSEDHWDAIVAMVNPAWLEAIMETHLEIVFDDEEPAHMSAAEAIEAVKSMSTEELEDLAVVEDRKTVLAAIEKRYDELTE
ncbi:hypothetical protein LCGC14_2158150 [marine sediment metagenome]|uniref:Uncharacterized protein n=1 Tax=marine sediment metagenome TaxID=412755 RepID=A0A0F9EFS0_9ZZZZ